MDWDTDYVNPKTWAKIEDKCYDICDLLDQIKDEIMAVHADYPDLESDEKKQVPVDLKKIKNHLHTTAKYFTHLKGMSSPDWR